ncbi:hypothetical protein KA005_57260, partial [bacterium]|nr:hypothetical protein [bacterium]
LNIFIRRAENEEFKSYLEETLEYYWASLKSARITYTIDDKVYTPKAVFNLWANGEFFHLTSGKRKKLEKLQQMDNLSEAMMLDILITYINWIRFLGVLLKDSNALP